MVDQNLKIFEFRGFSQFSVARQEDFLSLDLFVDSNYSLSQKPFVTILNILCRETEKLEHLKFFDKLFHANFRTYLIDQFL